MQILDLANIVLLSVIKNLQKIVRLITDCQQFALFRLKRIFSKEGGIIAGPPYVRLPISLLIVEGINEFFESLEIVEDLSVFGNEVIDLLSFCLNSI